MNNMLEFLNSFLPIVIYILLIALIILLIIIAAKTIRTMKKVEDIVDDVDDKVQSLNDFFYIVDSATDKIALLSDRVIDIVTGVIHKITEVKKRKSKIKEEDYED